DAPPSGHLFSSCVHPHLPLHSFPTRRSSDLALQLVGFPSLRAQTPSKLSAHLINAYTAGASNIIAGHPRVLKILDLGSGMLQAARLYKAGTPAGKLVLRVYTSKSYPITADPGASATNFWATVLQPPIN